MLTKPAIRRSLPSDAAIAEALYRRAFGPGHAWWSRGIECSNFLTQLRTLGWVAEGPEGLLAFATAQATTERYSLMHGLAAGLPEAPWKAYLRDSWYLSSVAVEPKHQRLGTARRLAEARIEAARQAGAAAVFVSCLEGSGTVSLYTALGFVALEQVEDWTATGESAQLMFMPLRAPGPRMVPARPSFGQHLVLLYMNQPWLLAGLALGSLSTAWVVLRLVS